MLTVRAELARMRHWPAIEYQTLICNGLIATLCFVALPVVWKDWLFSEFQGKQAFVLILISWMISDVIASNLLGHDPNSALEALSHSGGIARLIRVKATALSLCVGGIGTVVATILGIVSHHLGLALGMVPIYFATPLATVCVGSLLGVIAPYRLRTARWRWENRKRWFMQLRWAILVFVPSWFLGTFISFFVIPLHLFSKGTMHLFHRVLGPGAQIFVFSGTLVVETALLVLILPALAQILANRRREKLRNYLTSEEAG